MATLRANTRRVERLRLAYPLVGRLGSVNAAITDLSLYGARIEHAGPLAVGLKTRLRFDWKEAEVTIDAEVVRCKVDRFSSGPSGLTVYHSGLRFTSGSDSFFALREVISAHIAQALEEQKANARGALPPSLSRLPIFRRGILTANRTEVAEEMPSRFGAAQVAKQSGYICCRLEGNSWKKTQSSDPSQPEEGFTVSVQEDPSQVELLCDSYRKSDEVGRKMIRMLSELSIEGGDGIPAGRFDIG